MNYRNRITRLLYVNIRLLAFTNVYIADYQTINPNKTFNNIHWIKLNGSKKLQLKYIGIVLP